MADYYIYNVSKRKNSTLVPTNGIRAELVLKSGTSLLDPVLLLHDTHKPVISEVWFEGRYYFVNDVVSVRNDLWELHCKVDVLATYKANILATPAFVLYDSAANTEISDGRLSLNTTKTVSRSYGNNTLFESGYSVLVGVVGKNNTGVYALTVSQAASLLHDLNNWTDGVFEDTTDVAESIILAAKQLIATGKAPDCIKSAMLFPIDVSKWPGSSSEVYLGDYPTGITGKLLSASAQAFETTDISIPWQFSDWRRNAPYTQLYLTLPFLGTINIPTAHVMGDTTIRVATYVSQSGTVNYTASVPNGARIGRWGAVCANGFMIGSSNVTPFGTASGIGTLAGAGLGAVLATGLPGLLAAGTAAIIGVKNAIEAMPTCIGGAGGAVMGQLAMELQTVCHNTTVDPASVSAVMGTPTMATKTPSAGYVETRCFSVSGTMTDRERSEINSLMDGGVYIE